MTTALSLFVILTLSAIAVRVGAAALWLTGLPEDVARFQALSAFTTTGFTTSQASLVVSHPDRRRIISVLMILGNAGIISVIATVILSYVEFEPSVESIVLEVFWLAAAAVVFWVVGISKWADRYITRFIRWSLRGRTRLTADRIENLLLLPNGYQVAAITVGDANKSVNELLSALPVSGQRVIVLGVLHSDDTYISATLEEIEAQPTDRILLYGITRDLEALQTAMVR
jgi:hypothetical protein